MALYVEKHFIVEGTFVEIWLLNNYLNFSCNCDAPVSSNGNGDNSYMMEDSGFLMEKEYLPVRQIRAGGTTGSSTQDKTIGFIVGDMYCAGDSKYSDQSSLSPPLPN